ncbi:MAG: Rab family GTPase [Candidatus Korarchaeota archaeon]
MVSKKPDGSIYCKLVYWGPSMGGKTTSVDKLYSLLAQQKSQITPISEFYKIAMASGSTLFFDRGVFQYSGSPVYFQVYTVAGQPRFRMARKSVYSGADGIIFVADSDPTQWKENVDSLDELIYVTAEQGRKLIEEIPLVFMLNKRDLPNAIPKDSFIDLLKRYGLILPPQHPLFAWSPTVYETIATQGVGVVRAFGDCARRIVLYHVKGPGRAPEISEIGK